jgi:hypothetical protein
MFRSKCRREWLPSSNVKGVVHRLYRLEGFNHAFDVFSKYLPQGPPAGLDRPKVAEAFDVVLSFLTKRVRIDYATPSTR